MHLTPLLTITWPAQKNTHALEYGSSRAINSQDGWKGKTRLFGSQDLLGLASQCCVHREDACKTNKRSGRGDTSGLRKIGSARYLNRHGNHFQVSSRPVPVSLIRLLARS